MVVAISLDDNLEWFMLIVISLLLVLLFLDEPRLNVIRLHRILKNLCYHSDTLLWIVRALISILIKANDSKDHYGEVWVLCIPFACYIELPFVLSVANRLEHEWDWLLGNYYFIWITFHLYRENKVRKIFRGLGLWLFAEQTFWICIEHFSGFVEHNNFQYL